MNSGITRREAIGRAGTALGAAAFASLGAASPCEACTITSMKTEFIYCLNTSTIKGQNLPLVEEIEIARKAGYSAIEPWISEIEDYVRAGGSLASLRKKLEDAN